MTQIFLASTFFTVGSMAAAIEEGRFDTGRPNRRLLLLYSSAYAPETMTPLTETPGASTLLKHFDDVLSWNELIYPYHAHEWAPHVDDALLVQRLLRESWELGHEDPDLIMEAIQVNPALALAAIFPESRIHVVSDGLMSYGPTRSKIPRSIGSRIEQLLHVDLAPGLSPILLTEHRVPSRLIDTAALRAVISDLETECRQVIESETKRTRGETAVALGQYLAALDIVSDAEEERLQRELIVWAGRATGGSVLFKPHPAAPPASVKRLVETVRLAGVRVDVSRVPVPVEVMYGALRPRLVVSCFSTGLATASQLFDLPVAGHGTGLVLDRFKPYQNSNRIPATLVHAFVPRLTESGVAAPRVGAAQLGSHGQQLVNAVAYCMQPSLYPELRRDAEGFVQGQDDEVVRQYIGREQISVLELYGPGHPVARAVSRSRRMFRRARRLSGRLARRLRS